MAVHNNEASENKLYLVGFYAQSDISTTKSEVFTVINEDFRDWIPVY